MFSDLIRDRCLAKGSMFTAAGSLFSQCKMQPRRLNLLTCGMAFIV